MTKQKYNPNEIEKKWHPDAFIGFKDAADVSLASWSPRQFSYAALICAFFAPPEKVKWQEILDPSHQSRIFDYTFYLPTLFRTVLEMGGGWILKKYSNLKNRLFKIKPHEVDFLLFSGGFNLYYNKSLFEHLLSNRKYLVTTGDHLLEHEWLLKTQSFHYTPLAHFLTRQLSDQVDKTHQQISKKIDSILTQTEVTQLLFPSSLPEVCKQACLAKLRLVFRQYTLKFVRQTILAQEVIRSSRPKLVITTHDPGPSALPFVFLAKRKHIPTLVLLHGFHDVHFGADHKSDYMALWGKLVQNRFEKILHKPRKTLFTVGFPHLDEIFQKKQAFWQRNLGQFKPRNPVKIGFLCTLYPPNTFILTKYFHEVMEKFKQLPFPIEVWIRTHSGQIVHELRSLGDHYGVKTMINPKTTLNEFLESTDVIVSWDTTAILWPMLFGKPLFYMSPWWAEANIPANKYQAAWTVKNAAELVKGLDYLVHHPEAVTKLHPGQRQFLNDALGVIDGTSGEKLANLIEHLLTSSA